MDDTSQEHGMATAADVGSDVWALMPAESTSICTECGSPNRLCQHVDAWKLFDIPLVATGKLLSYVASVERALPDCRVENAGLDCPVAIFRTEDAAKTWLRREHATEMDLFRLWATGKRYAPNEA
jgi:transposase